jgi:hypothetical protein
MIVVIPSARSIRLDYLAPLIEAGAKFIIVDDSEGTIRINHPQFEEYNWSDRRRMLGNLDEAMPRRNGACRDFGFYLAWRESADDDIIIAIDDDCMVEDADFAEQVKCRLSDSVTRVTVSCGRHLNILELYSNLDHANLFPRGFPYSQRAGHTRCRFEGQISGEVAFNVGLWTGVFDINAVDKIDAPTYCYPTATLLHENVVVPRNTLVAVCSMNMQFRRRLIPAVFQLPMHVEIMPGWVIDRFGDIWGGFILKTLMDIRGDRMSVGGPMIRHVKDGSYVRNIWQEHLCHLVNDEFIELLDCVCARIKPASYVDMMGNLCDEFAMRRDGASPILKAYLRYLDVSLRAWVALLR